MDGQEKGKRQVGVQMQTKITTLSGELHFSGNANNQEKQKAYQ